MLQRYFRPTWLVESIYQITAEDLHRQGISGIVTDLDNTLLPWHELDATPELLDWVKNLNQCGIKVMILSNNHTERVQRVAEQMGVIFYASALKPLRRGIRSLLDQTALEADQIVLVGDQLLTDIFSANRMGIKSALVQPMVKTDIAFSKVNRCIERALIKHFQKSQAGWEWKQKIE
ncbi:MAG: YqeG family HAD IIIA-type phosphatase [Aerococcus sp.]|nr:YqeG family HAD IIIA-type phosphatase [Aerococcus sp.]